MDYNFYRYFRLVLGDISDFDPGMLVEFVRDYKVIFCAYEHDTCKYKIDETACEKAKKLDITFLHVNQLMNVEAFCF